jgi:hypothetical protein
MSALKIYQSFVNNIRSSSMLSGMGIAYENQSFKPVAGKPYAQLRYFPNETAPLGIGSTNETTGVFSVTLRYPVDLGAIVVKSKAQAIVDHFRPGSYIYYEGQRVDIVHSSSGSGIIEEGWYKQTIDIRFRAFSAR